jgi:hypothetical protein
MKKIIYTRFLKDGKVSFCVKDKGGLMGVLCNKRTRNKED